MSVTDRGAALGRVAVHVGSRHRSPQEMGRLTLPAQEVPMQTRSAGVKRASSRDRALAEYALMMRALYAMRGPDDRAEERSR